MTLSEVRAEYRGIALQSAFAFMGILLLISPAQAARKKMTGVLDSPANDPLLKNATMAQLAEHVPLGQCCCNANKDCMQDEIPLFHNQRCCKFMPRDMCYQRNLYYVGRGLRKFVASKHPERCGLYRGYLEVKIQGKGTWELLTVDNWVLGTAVRAVIDTGVVDPSRSKFLNVTMQLINKGKVAYTYSDTVVSTSHSGILLEKELDTRLEFIVVLTIQYMRGAEKLDKNIIRRRVYRRPETVCGVGVFIRRGDLEAGQRNCAVLDPAAVALPSNFRNIPNYALGVEYEMVGAPNDGPSSLIETNSSSKVDSDEFDSSFEYANHTAAQQVNVFGFPCWDTFVLGYCGRVKSCLWNKLGWNEETSKAWGIEVDTSVKPLTPGNTDDEKQHKGIPFEIVSPKPREGVMVGPGGLHSALTVLTAIRDMGAQASLSAGLHVHVNVRNKHVGTKEVLTMKELVAVYVNWIRYQLIIDEIISPDRVNNEFAKGLYLGWGLDIHRSKAVEDIFSRAHERIWKMSGHDDDNMDQIDACKTMIGNKTLNFCGSDTRLPHDMQLKQNPEKFFQVNLTPLGKFGTLEFRAGSATVDPERVARWIQFIVAFIDTFKVTSSVEQFFDESMETDLQQLQEAQDSATLEEMREKMQGKVESDFVEYFATERPFEDQTKHPEVVCLKMS